MMKLSQLHALGWLIHTNRHFSSTKWRCTGELHDLLHPFQYCQYWRAINIIISLGELEEVFVAVDLLRTWYLSVAAWKTADHSELNWRLICTLACMNHNCIYSILKVCLAQNLEKETSVFKDFEHLKLPCQIHWTTPPEQHFAAHNSLFFVSSEQKK